ncbi:MAG: protein phosphatase 2C domain-containing protein [Rikenellaceae bacterium]
MNNLDSTQNNITAQSLETKSEQYDYIPTSPKISKAQNSRRITLIDVDTTSIKTPYEIYAASAIGGRAENQDYYSAVETPYGLLLLVCDGMGGANGGATASRLAVETIIEKIENSSTDTAPKELLHSVIEHANTIVHQRSISEPQLNGMGTTIVALLLSDHKATVAHVGDSRLYQIRKKRAIFRTFDHSMVFELVRRGSLTEEEARLSAGSNVILQALGTKSYLDNIEITDNLTYLKGDRFMLCTDGICGAVPEGKLLELTTSNKSVKLSVDKLMSTINDIGIAAGNEHDNLTAIILEMKGRSELTPNVKRKSFWIYLVIILALVIVVSSAALFWYKNNLTSLIE